MNQNPQHPSGNIPQSSETFGNVRNDSEHFGKVPNDSEAFRTIPKDAESFRNVPKVSERKENHTLTVREAARLFETAGVARTERSIINWCQPNRQGISRLDSYFDPNERKYYLTPQSVETVIQEEVQKATKTQESPVSEPVGNVRKASERAEPSFPKDAENREIKELENQVRDLQITNKAKDIVIDQLQKERANVFDQLLAANRKVGELETKLLQLEEPKI